MSEIVINDNLLIEELRDVSQQELLEIASDIAEFADRNKTAASASQTAFEIARQAAVLEGNLSLATTLASYAGTLGRISNFFKGIDTLEKAIAIYYEDGEQRAAYVLARDAVASDIDLP